jgi:hypothetical protein
MAWNLGAWGLKDVFRCLGIEMRRPQFSIRTLLWMTLVVAAFSGGIAFGKRMARREYAEGWLELEEMREAIEAQ